MDGTRCVHALVKKRGMIIVIAALSAMLFVPFAFADTTLTSNTTYDILQVGTGSTFNCNGFHVTVNGTNTGGTLIYGKLNCPAVGGSATLFTQKKGGFETSGVGSVLMSGTGLLLLTGSGTTHRLAASGTLMNLTIDNGLAGYWRMDDRNGAGSGTVAVRDYSRNRNPGTFYATPTWSGAVLPGFRFFNRAFLKFDGSGSKDTIYGADGIPINSNAVSLSCWIRSANIATSQSCVGKYLGSAVRPYELRVQQTTGNLRFSINTGTATSCTTTDNPLQSNRWHHLAGVWDGATMKMYIDGNLNATSCAKTGTLNNDSTAKVWMGGTAVQAVPMNGYIEDVRIYNRVLTASEIKALFNGYPSTGSGIYVSSTKLAISGSLAIHAGELWNTHNTTVTGSFLNVGGFSGGTVFFRGNTHQTISGGTVFNTLNIAGPSRTIFADFTGRQSISGALLINGTASKIISLRSTRAGSGARIALDGSAGTQSISYLDVKDSDASGGATLSCTGCTNSGNNTNWLLTAINTIRKHYFWFFGW